MFIRDTIREVRDNVPVHNGRVFRWTGDEGVIEASELNAKMHDRIFDDSLDVGFLVESPVTGTKKLFIHTNDVTDREGESLYANYVSADKRFTIKIFND